MEFFIWLQSCPMHFKHIKNGIIFYSVNAYLFPNLAIMDGAMLPPSYPFLKNCQRHSAQNKSTSVSDQFPSILILITLFPCIVPSTLKQLKKWYLHKCFVWIPLQEFDNPYNSLFPYIHTIKYSKKAQTYHTITHTQRDHRTSIPVLYA